MKSATRIWKTLIALTCLGLIGGAATAQESPYTEPDGSWITLSGTVTSATDTTFNLDYGRGVVTVEMDDWDWYADGKSIIAGDNVTVYGRVDDDLFELTTIEASSVYVEDLNTYFYASAADEEGAVIPTTTVVLTETTVTGEVVNVNAEMREFTIEVGDTDLSVETIQMAYNPLDDDGFQQIDEGDRVRVTGTWDNDLLDEPELVADTIITLQQDVGKATAMEEDEG